MDLYASAVQWQARHSGLAEQACREWQGQEFYLILENFRLCLIQRTLEELPDFEVMTWQLCRMLRSALNCFQVTRFCVQK